SILCFCVCVCVLIITNNIKISISSSLFFLSSGQMVDPMYLKPMQFCSEEHENYCINGDCLFHKELRIPTCRCLTGYSGERCEHLMLNTYAHHSYERYVAFGVGAGMLLIGVFAVIYCCVRKSCSGGSECLSAHPVAVPA
uniref:Epithelial mitogen n=1 Tax=Salvator merianae TaxID=96440 RepID=A0A8D0KIB8_SALMN